MTKLSIIIILYNEFDMLRKCIDSIYQDRSYTGLKLEIIVVDNASKKEGLKKLQEAYPEITFIKNKENFGFGKAVNIGFKKSHGEYILLLNPDSLLLRGTFGYTIPYIESHKQIGLLGCPMYSLNRELQPSVHKNYPSLLSHLYEYNIIFYKLINLFYKGYHPTVFPLKEHRRILKGKHGMGAYMLMRREAFASIDGFDERFFLYREETDLGKRLKEAGWELLYLPSKYGVVHFGAGSTRIKITQTSPHYMKSTYLFFIKHYGLFYAILAWLIGLLSVLVSILYLGLVSMTKQILNKPSQAKQVLPLWIKIAKWHVTEGIKVILQRSK